MSFLQQEEEGNSTSNGSISPIPIVPVPYCTDGYINNVPGYIKDIAAVTSALSVVGSILIIISYVCYKTLRTKAREVVVHISMMDLMTALANLIGIAIDFDARLYRSNNEDIPPHYNVYNGLCITQAAFAMYGTLASILWTLAITVYFYIRIMASETDAKYIKRSVYAFYGICYGLPLITVVWFGATGKIGYSPVGGSGWCSLVTETHDIQTDSYEKDRIALFFGNSVWIYVTFLLIPVMSITLLIYLRLKVNTDDISNKDKSRVSLIEIKLLAIPLIFVFLRMWSELLSIITIHTGNESCGLVLFLLVMGGIGDSGQGFFNAIIFCVLNSKVRTAYFETLKKWSLKLCRKHSCTEEEMDSPLINEHC